MLFLEKSIKQILVTQHYQEQHLLEMLYTITQQLYRYLLELPHKDLVHLQQETLDLTVRPLLLKYITVLSLLLWEAVLELREEVMMKYSLNRTLT